MSIFLRQQERSRAPVALRDDPKLHARAQSVTGKNSPAALQAQLVFVNVLGGQFTPIARQVPLQKRERRFSRCPECFQGSWRCDNLPRAEFRLAPLASL